MRCPKCGFHSFDYLDNCKKCGVDLTELKLRFKFQGYVAPAPAATGPESAGPAPAAEAVESARAANPSWAKISSVTDRASMGSPLSRLVTPANQETW